MARHGRGKGEFGVFSAGELCQEASKLDVQAGEYALLVESFDHFFIRSYSAF
jgi:hypothetical protein